MDVTEANLRWTVERIDRLVNKIVREKKTAHVATLELNAETGSHFTRNAIIGKIDRLGLHDQPPAPTPLHRQMLALAPTHCRWIENNAFCCAPITDRQSYCSAHHRRVYL